VGEACDMPGSRSGKLQKEMTTAIPTFLNTQSTTTIYEEAKKKDPPSNQMKMI
jgi:hypothetical protein